MVKALFLLFILISLPLQAKNCTKEVIEKLMQLYPEQSKKMMKLRIENAKNKHMFMRAFIPYYYREAYKLRESIPAWKKLKKHVGQIVGDAHVGNFGFMTNNTGRPVLTLNDFDDVAEAPLFLDVMRLSQSASYIGDFDQVRFLEAYKKGLAGVNYKLSEYVSELGQKAKKGGMTTKADFTVTSEGPRFRTKSEPAAITSKKEKESLEKIVKQKFGPQSRLHDAYSTMKESGGSAFGTRYHSLVEIDGNIHFIEFKEIMDGGVVSKWTPGSVTNQQRIENAKAVFLGDSFDGKLEVVTIGERPFQLRFKAKGNKSIDVKAVDEEKLSSVIEDEFYTLGQLHRNSLGVTDGLSDYLHDFNKVTPSEWEESVQVMKKSVKEAYNAGKK